MEAIKEKLAAEGRWGRQQLDVISNLCPLSLGVFMRQYSDEPIVPMLDGSYRDRFLYPRVQVKILNEQIYIIGLKEGVEPVLSLVDNVKSFNFDFWVWESSRGVIIPCSTKKIVSS